MPRFLKARPRVAAVLLMALATSGIALAQQAQTAGTLDGHTEPVYSIAWSPDGKMIVTGGFDNTVRLWDAATRKERQTFKGHDNLVLAVAFSPDGKRILSGGLDKTAKIWDIPPSGPTKELPNPAGVHAMATSPDGKQAAAASGAAVVVWDLGGGTQVRTLGHAGDVESVAWRGDGAQIASGDKAKTIHLWNAADGAAQGVLETPADTILGLAYLPNNQQVVSAGSDGLARLWQLAITDPRVISPKGEIKAFAANADGSKVATSSSENVIQVWNSADGALVKEIGSADQTISALALKPDGSQVAAALADKTIHVWNVADGNEIK
ncbi:MAG TPA: WD40 repeat domain-containing protein, partial [Isosphaeraceae bacterium]|nr:WD40 repeat domain-containing protein [Isosphaeraceae bacterium]